MKLAEDGQELLLQEVLDMGNGLFIYKTHVDRTREQDKNAQVMDKAMFERLKQNIADDKRLESLPFGQIVTNHAGNIEFSIISGHHRVRAARMAEITELFVLATKEELTRDQVISKQLAHNAITGESNPQVLKQLYDDIKDIDQKIKTGLNDDILSQAKYKPVSIDDTTLEFEFNCVKLMFLPSQLNKLDKVMAQVVADDTVLLADKADFDRYAATIRELSKTDNVRNIAGIMSRMLDITAEYLAEQKQHVEEGGKPEDKRNKFKKAPKATIGFKRSIDKPNEGLKPGME